MSVSYNGRSRPSNPPYKQLTETFLDMEDELDLFHKQIGGIFYWEDVRTTVESTIRSQVIDFGADIDLQLPANRQGLYGTFRTAVQSGKNVISNNPFKSTDADILVFGGSRRKQLDDGNWWNIYHDPVLNDLDSDYLYFENATSDRPEFHLQPAKTADIKYLDLPYFLGTLLGKVSGEISLTTEEKAHLKTVEDRIATEFDTSVDLVELVRNRLSVYRTRAPFLEKIITLNDPQIVVTEVGNEIITRVCDDLGIPVAIVQNGVSTRYNLRYHQPVDGPIQTFGDYYLVWGEYWRTAAEYPLPQERILSVGFPYLDIQRHRCDEVTEKEQILFVSQPTIGDDLSKFATELSGMDIGYDIVYKLHPRENAFWEEEYSWLNDADLSVAPPRSGTLYELFAESKAIVGVNSTTLWESSVFDLQTFQVPLTGYHEVTYLLEEGISTVVDTPNDLASHLRDGVSPVTFDSSLLFEQDSMTKYQDQIEWLAENATKYRG